MIGKIGSRLVDRVTVVVASISVSGTNRVAHYVRTRKATALVRMNRIDEALRALAGDGRPNGKIDSLFDLYQASPQAYKDRIYTELMDSIMAAVEANPTSGPVERVRWACLAGYARHHAGKRDAGSLAIEPAYQAALQIEDRADRAYFLSLIAWTCGEIGLQSQGQAIGAEALETASRLEEGWQKARALCAVALSLAEANLPDLAYGAMKVALVVVRSTRYGTPPSRFGGPRVTLAKVLPAAFSVISALRDAESFALAYEGFVEVEGWWQQDSAERSG